MTIIEKIKAEIERLKAVQLKRIQEGDLVDAEPYDKIEAYNELLSFLDTLESEKLMNQDESLNEEIKKEMVKLPFFIRGKDQIAFARHFYDLGCRRTAEKYDEIEYNRQRAEESEKPMNLEEEINRYLREECSDDDEPGIHEIAEHFAKWGAEHLDTSGKTISVKSGDEITINGHKIIYDKDKGYVTIVKSEESVPKDLEEAAVDIADALLDKPKDYVLSAKADYWNGAHDGIIAGAKWQAEHTPLPEDTVLFNKGVEEGKRLMMEEAVEYEVWDFSVEAYPHVNIPLDNKQYRNGDKVRVIVLPKEREK